ncbi:MAG: hypothetical protein JXA54_09560 [Candidatus Heimdallarchaeota archaeon]|nr:hypothetical protein [Candidatus Heimdallarchaeota archaeon]
MSVISVINEIFEHKSILSTHIAKKIVEDEGVDIILKSPLDIAIVCHDKHYVKKELISKMAFHLSENGYLERNGETYSLVEQWRRSLSPKTTSIENLKSLGAYQLFLLEEYIAKYFLDIVRNDIQKLNISKFIYYLDTIDSAKGLQTIRSEAISLLESNGSPKNILNIDFGLGHSTIQLSSIYQKSKIFSIQLESSLREAFEYTIKKFSYSNIFSESKYPSELVNKLMIEKVDLIFLFNPFGFNMKDIDRYLTLASQTARKGTKLVIYVPFVDQPNNTLLAEWLAMCIESIEFYRNFDYYNVALSKHNFEIKEKKANNRFIIANYNP